MHEHDRGRRGSVGREGKEEGWGWDEGDRREGELELRTGRVERNGKHSSQRIKADVSGTKYDAGKLNLSIYLSV